MKYDVKVIKAGSYEPLSEAVLVDGGDADKFINAPSLIFALIDENGETIICDTSFSDPEKCTRIMANTPYPVTVMRDQPLPELMRANGIEPNDVKTVILSHHHWDHAGGTWAFPNAKVYIQKSDWEFAMADANFGPEFVKELTDLTDRVVLIDGHDDTTFPGIEMVPVGGHSEGSMLLYVDTNTEGTVCLAFDVIMCRRNIQEKKPIGLSYKPDEAAAALELVLRRGGKVYYGHDIEE